MFMTDPTVSTVLLKPTKPLGGGDVKSFAGFEGRLVSQQNDGPSLLVGWTGTLPLEV